MPRGATLPHPGAARSFASAGRRCASGWLAALLLAATPAHSLTAAQVSRETASRAAAGWLARNPTAMGLVTGRAGSITVVSAVNSSEPLCYVVAVDPAGFVAIAADDEVEPVLAFSTRADFLAQPGTPLFDLLRCDARARITATRRRNQLAIPTSPSRPSPIRARWNDLLATGAEVIGAARPLGLADVSDVCVAPMVNSRWDQVSTSLPAVPPTTSPTELYIYNYYTPPYGPGNRFNYPAGCAPVAWAQIMRFHRWPRIIGASPHVIGIDNWPYMASTVGGDGQGGAYDWDNMPLEPSPATTVEQMKAIGALLLDAGIGVGANYTYYGTYASTTDADIKSVFHYAEAKTCVPSASLDELMKAARTSLDAGLPANLNIFTADHVVGHSLVIDGYGYNAGTRYHHLNLGWSGHCDAWYNFPPVDVVLGDGSPELFTIITYLTYNIDPSVAGEMITGRITTDAGKPVGGAIVTIDTTPARSVTTDRHGIYAIKGLAPSTTYALSAAAEGYLLETSQATATTGDSATEIYTTPNRIVDFRGNPVAVAFSHPQGLAAGAAVQLSVATNAAQPVAWLRNGTPLAQSAAFSLDLPSLQPAQAGLYELSLTRSNETIASELAIVGIESAEKIAGAGREVLSDVYVASNGNTFDQVLLEGAAVSVTADAGERQITRVSFLDLDDDIVQVEFSGPGTLTLVLDQPSGPALPVNYVQDVKYMKGHAGLVITGATADSHLAIFSVGRATAANPNLFKPDVNYDGIADLAFVAISSRDGQFGGVRAANAHFFASRGVTGVYAPGVALAGPLYLGDVTAFDTARPVIIVGAATDVRITGGDLYQDNGRAVQVTGLTQIRFQDGTDSHGHRITAKTNRGTLRDHGSDVTGTVVINP